MASILILLPSMIAGVIAFAFSSLLLHHSLHNFAQNFFISMITLTIISVLYACIDTNWIRRTNRGEFSILIWMIVVCTLSSFCVGFMAPYAIWFLKSMIFAIDEFIGKKLNPVY